MDKSKIMLREIGAEDGPAIAKLSAVSSDGGMISFSQIYQMDPYEAVRIFHGDMTGVAACDLNSEELVGLALVRYGECRFEGDTLPFALLNTLMVHPDFRRLGIATQLANWRIEHARRRYGKDVLLVANIQNGNSGSFKTASKWSRQVLGPVTFLPMKVNSSPPTPPTGFTARPAMPDEYEEVVEGLNRFYRNYNFYRPLPAQALQEMVSQTPFETPFRHYWVAVDGQGCIQAGTGILEEYRLRVLHIKNLPPTLRLLNQFLQMVPKDNISRELFLDRTWYNPGQEKAARFLLDCIRWEWRERATNVGTAFDPNSPLRDVFTLKPWTPKTQMNIAVNGPKEVLDGRLVCPIF